jgi:hypothetical protein
VNDHYSLLTIAVLNPTGSHGQYQKPSKFVRNDDHHSC